MVEHCPNAHVLNPTAHSKSSLEYAQHVPNPAAQWLSFQVMTKTINVDHLIFFHKEIGRNSYQIFLNLPREMNRKLKITGQYM